MFVFIQAFESSVRPLFHHRLEANQNEWNILIWANGLKCLSIATRRPVPPPGIKM